MPRKLLLAAGALVVLSVAKADDAFVRQSNFDRPGGGYLTLPAADPAACAAQCARDGLCLAWSFQPGASALCSLKAVVTPARPAPGITSGLAARAPRFAALVGADVPRQPAKLAAAAPTGLVSATPGSSARARADYGLLGGPDDRL